MSSCMGIGLSAAGIDVGIGVGVACRRCALGVACRLFLTSRLDFAIGDIFDGFDGIFMPSCMGAPSIPDIAPCFSIMPSAGIAPPPADMGGWLDACPVPWACAANILGDSRNTLASASERQ